jgi:short-subunit dehydrogenase
MPRPTVLITGASAGIGAELARLFAGNRYDLILAARREDRLEELAQALDASARIDVVPVDLAKVRGPQKLFDAVSALGREVDVLVNNAGVIETGPMLETPGPRLAHLINLNVRALTELIRLFVPPMVSRGRGRVLNLASLASFQPVPGMAAYAASKSYVLSLSEALAEELRGTGVSVTALCPGPTKTDMATAFDSSELSRWLLADPRQVAREGFEALKAGEVIRVPGFANQALVNWTHYQPRWLVRLLSGIASRSSALLK